MSPRGLRDPSAVAGLPLFFATPPPCPRCRPRARRRAAAVPIGPARRCFGSQPRPQSPWAAAVSKLQATVADVLPLGPGSAADNVTVDPLKMVGRELKFLNKNIRQLLGSGHPLLDTVAKYYTQSEGKLVRPLLVLLMSRATAFAATQPRHGPADDAAAAAAAAAIDTPISSPTVLFDTNPDQAASSPRVDAVLEHEPEEALADVDDDDAVLPSQRRLAEITELIHTASLLHDDVIDVSTTRRSAPSANLEFGNKMAVLAGDFLLGRASVALARLRDPEVIELLATVIANLVEGEFMQLKNTAVGEADPQWTDHTLSYYLQKTYLKSASLISKSCRAAALLGHCAPNVVEAAYAYGRNLGLAFQLVDDMLDYTVSGGELGKPAGADLELGLATAPLLFAWRTHPELGKLVGRRFSKPGDVQRARDIVVASNGIEQTRALAQEYADKAIAAISAFPPGDAKAGLEGMCVKGNWDYNKHYLPLHIVKWLIDDDYLHDHVHVTASGENERVSLVRALVYVDEHRTQRGQINDEYVGRMNRAIAESTALGLPRDWVDAVIRRDVVPGVELSDRNYVGRIE
ncbi:hypothetical protein DV736_g4063, partial [Chaetothyriales sp. CBS 134916]